MIAQPVNRTSALKAMSLYNSLKGGLEEENSPPIQTCFLEERVPFLFRSCTVSAAETPPPSAPQDHELLGAKEGREAKATDMIHQEQPGGPSPSYEGAKHPPRATNSEFQGTKCTLGFLQCI